MQRNLKHFANPSFWTLYNRLPQSIQKLINKNFNLFKSSPYHPSLHLKKVGRYWFARVGRNYRAVALEIDEGLIWFWIGKHAEYDQLIK